MHTSAKPIQADIEECLQHIEPKDTDIMNELHSQTFTRADVEEALHQMATLKVLGLDGFRACFYQNH